MSERPCESARVTLTRRKAVKEGRGGGDEEDSGGRKEGLSGGVEVWLWPYGGCSGMKTVADPLEFACAVGVCPCVCEMGSALGRRRQTEKKDKTSEEARKARLCSKVP